MDLRHSIEVSEEEKGLQELKELLKESENRRLLAYQSAQDEKDALEERLAEAEKVIEDIHNAYDAGLNHRTYESGIQRAMHAVESYRAKYPKGGEDESDKGCN